MHESAPPGGGTGARADYDPVAPRTVADPYPALAAIREQAPLYWCERLHAWVVTRHADVRRLARDEAFSADRLRPFFAQLGVSERACLGEVMRYLNAWMVFTDPPEHTRLRALAAGAFAPARIGGLAARIEALVHRLLDAGDAPGGVAREADLVARLAGPLPALVIMDMLGLDADDLASIKRWSDDVALFIGSDRGSPDKYRRAESGAHALAEYFRPILAARRRRPGDDLLSEMLTVAAASGDYSDDEVVATAMLLLFAGHETTTHLIANGVHAMLRSGEAWAALRSRPTLARAAVEESLRFDGPVNSLPRVAARALEWHGCQVETGQRLFGSILAANRDPRVFPEPDRFDLMRRTSRHLGFGHGIHVCLGAPLARLESTVALQVLAARCPDLALGRRKPEWMPSLVFRGMRALHVTGLETG